MSTVRWTENGTTRVARWHSENAAPAPGRIVTADDRMNATHAHRLIRTGTALLWRGDLPQARGLLAALGHRVDRRAPDPAASPPTCPADLAETYRAHRRARRHCARTLGGLLVLLGDDHALDLRRALDVRRACAEAYGPPTGPTVVSLTELLGVIGAHQWRRNGVEVAALGAHVHPHYGVFSPVRGEYVDLVARAPLPARTVRAFDLGTGTGVLAALLARRGLREVVATDINPRALVCARDNVRRLGLTACVEVTGPALYPEGRADLVVCNPPWLPVPPSSALERGVHDADGAMLHGFLDGLTAHLRPGGEGWLVLSDLAEHLGLRTRTELLTAVGAAGLRVVDRIATRPRHPRARDTGDPLHPARVAEITSLWRLTPG
ncbi:methyltransferase [Streptomyces uncialis]|uniref:methyltransferase n=1 Tax=Streptomyces uncialis TaxID=1048205 RepID=UPI0037A21304